MELERPDLTGLPLEVVDYIEALEAELLHGGRSKAAAQLEESEAPTSQQVITITADGMGKRTPRHLYSRQRRGGMGVFGLDVVNDNPPAHLGVADLVENLLLLTDRGRAFHLPVEKILETEVRGRGAPLGSGFSLGREERVVAVLPQEDTRSLVLASERGWVRRYRASFVGAAMYQGTSLHDIAQGGLLTAACWSHSEDDLFLATEKGQALRFPGQHVRDRRGCLGIRLEEGDRLVAVTPVSEQSGVFMLGADGIGTIRLMAGFRATKAPGAGGKVAIKSDKVIGVVTIAEADDLFVISRLGKIIRFAAQEVPAKTGVVQGVNIINLRADEAVALAAGRLATAQ